MNSLLVLLTVGASTIPAVLLLKAGTARELQAGPSTYRLSFPADLEDQSVNDFLAALSGRDWMGIELNPEYIEIAEARLKAERETRKGVMNNNERSAA